MQKFVLLLAIGLFGFQLFAEDEKSKAQASHKTPQLAGFGNLNLPNPCDASYKNCLGKCDSKKDPMCTMGCETDCGVCAVEHARNSDELCAIP